MGIEMHLSALCPWNQTAPVIIAISIECCCYTYKLKAGGVVIDIFRILNSHLM